MTRDGIITRGAALLALALLAPAACAPDADAPAAATEIHVSAASSLQRALPEIVTAYTERHGAQVVISFGASGSIAAQVQAGAPIDLFLAADAATIRGLEERKRTVPGTAAPYAVGRLALVACSGAADRPPTLAALAEPRYARVGVANPRLAPYGAAAKEALSRIGLWGAVEGRIVYGENAAIVRQHCSTKNVDAAFLPEALVAEPAGAWIEIPASLHAPLVQWLAVPATAPNPAGGRDLAAFLVGPPGRAVLARFGYTPPPGRSP